MNPWLNSSGLMSRRYVQQLGLRSPISIQVYRSVLDTFCRFVEKRSASTPLSLEVIREWRVTARWHSPLISFCTARGW